MKKVSMALVLLLAVMLVWGMACGGNGNIESTPTPTPTTVPTPTPTPTLDPRVQSDGRIGIIVENISRYNRFPMDLPLGSELKTGYNYATINLTLATVGGGLFRTLGIDGYSFFDSAGHKYDCEVTVTKSRPGDSVVEPGTNDNWYREASEIPIFQFPERLQPVKLRLGYRFSRGEEPWEESTEYQIDINLQ